MRQSSRDKYPHFGDNRIHLQRSLGEVDASARAKKTSSIRSAASIKLRLVTDTDRQTRAIAQCNAVKTWHSTAGETENVREQRERVY